MSSHNTSHWAQQADAIQQRSQESLGKEGPVESLSSLNYCGHYERGKTYYRGDAVLVGSVGFECLASETNTHPDLSHHWKRLDGPLGPTCDAGPDRLPTPDETARDRLLGLLGPGDVMRRRVVCVRPGMPVYQGDTIISGGCRLTVTDGVPRDAKIVNVFSDPMRYPLCVHVVFEHESFNLVYEGADIPHWCPSYTMGAECVTPEVQSDVARAYPE